MGMAGRTSRLLSTLVLYKTGYDFKRLFTISEFYDRDRMAFYRAIQSVRDQGMDMTGWLEFFATGLSTQMQEVKEHGERVIRRDLFLSQARKQNLKVRPLAILAFLMEKGKGRMAECVTALKMNRRTLQRDLNLLIEKKLIKEVGSSPTDPTKYYEPLL